MVAIASANRCSVVTAWDSVCLPRAHTSCMCKGLRQYSTCPHQRTAPAVYPRSEPQSHERAPSPESDSKSTGSTKNHTKNVHTENMTADEANLVTGTESRAASGFPLPRTRDPPAGVTPLAVEAASGSPLPLPPVLTPLLNNAHAKARTETDLEAPHFEAPHTQDNPQMSNVVLWSRYGQSRIACVP